MIGLIAALVLAVAVAATFLFLRGDDDPTPAATGTRAGTSTSESATPSPSPTSSATTPSAPAPADDFLATLPADFTDCQDAPLEGDGDTAHATCGASATQPGPQVAEFYLYPDKATMDAVFTEDVSDVGLGDLPAGQDCTTATGVTSWNSGNRNAGLVGCYLDAENNAAVIIWTDDAALIEGLVAAPGGSHGDLATLYQWWTQHSAYAQ